ncbi:MAG: hypothetical protein PHI12_06090 [Dehalococcoidales bacterium]|nr:hypothetical protein [Dehalococcoidales bacterium]
MARGLSWSNTAGIHQTNWRENKEVLIGQNGTQNGVEKDYILPANQWLLGIWEPVRDSLDDYLVSDEVQANEGKHNLKSSWVQCANLFFPFRYDPHMRYMLRSFLKRELNLDISTIDAVELEYAAPGRLAPKHLLNERGKRGSGQTSPDIAILFSCVDGSSGIYLIENKYTEHHFYGCSAAKKTISKEHLQQGLKPNPDSTRCRNVKGLVDNPSGYCHQIAWGRKYWSILADSIEKDAWRSLPYCPAFRDGYQLLRQQALAQGIAESGLFEYVYSGVTFDERNTELVQCLSDLGRSDFTTDWPKLFNDNSKVRFHSFTHQDFVSWISRSRSTYIREWSKYVKERYDY